MRNYYLTWQSASPPLLGTLFFVTIVYSTAYGLALVVEGEAVITLDMREWDIRFTLYCASIATSSMVPFLSLPIIWKTSDDSLEHLREARSQITRILRQVERREPITRAEKSALEVAFSAISHLDPKTEVRLVAEHDRILAREWRKISTELLAVVEGESAATLSNRNSGEIRQIAECYKGDLRSCQSILSK